MSKPYFAKYRPEDYVSFEVAKLLKEKGFGKDNPSTEYIWMYDEEGNLVEKQEEDYDIEGYYLRPTHALAIKWIRENFGIYIQYRVGFGDTVWYDYLIQWNNGNEYYTGKTNEYFNSPEQAVEAALLHTLKNLIP